MTDQPFVTVWTVTSRNAFVRCVLLLLLSALALSAVDPSTLKPEGYVNDYSRVIDAAGRTQLEQFALRLDRAAKVQFAFVTVDTLDGAPPEEFANNLYRTWGIGGKEKDEGLLVLLVVKDRKSRIEVGRGLEPYITDGTSGETLRQMQPLLREGRYGDALLFAASKLGNRVAQAKGIALPPGGGPAGRRHPPPQPVPVPWPVVLGGLFLLMWLMGSVSRAAMGGRRGRRGGGMGDVLTGMIIGNMLGGRGWGGHSSGGGFGGYDSSDTFGGFGGGDSGGGGASSDW